LIEIRRRPARPVAHVDADPADTPPGPNRDAAHTVIVDDGAALFARVCPRPILVLDRDRRVAFANPAAQSLLGATTTGRAFPEIVDDDGWDQHEGQREWRVCVKLGERFTYATIMRVDNDPRISGLVVFESNSGSWTESTRAIVTRLRDDSDALSQMGGAAKDMVASIHDAISDVSEGASTQVTRVEDTVRAITELADGINLVVEAVERARVVAASATDDATRGQDAARLAIDKMGTLRTTVGEAVETVQRLGQHSAKIGEIVGSITAIAQQTNMLALNAAIEAARAGEHGRGFAVVADEVRKLATRSSQSADEIVQLTAAISDDIDDVINTMDRGSSEVEGSSRVVNDSLAALAEIVGAIQATTEVIGDIQDATQIQRDGAESIVNSVDAVAVIAEDTSSASEATNRAVMDLKERIDALWQVAQGISIISDEVSASLALRQSAPEEAD